MKAAVMEGYRQPLVIRELEEPPLPEHGARVRVMANGICRSDWHTWVGDWGWMGGPKLEFPFVLGHEFCGVIEEVGRACVKFRPGDRVIVPFSQGEGTCEHCLSGNHQVCDSGLSPGWTYWAGYGERVAVPYAEINLVRLPESISFVEGASLGCRFMTSFHGLVDRARVHPGEWVAVHGCGGIGLSAVQIASAARASVIAVDIDPVKLAAARKQGAVATVNAASEDAIAAIRDLTRGGADVGVDALDPRPRRRQGRRLTWRINPKHGEKGVSATLQGREHEVFFRASKRAWSRAARSTPHGVTAGLVRRPIIFPTWTLEHQCPSPD